MNRNLRRYISLIISFMITIACSFNSSAADVQENLQNVAFGKQVTESFNDGERRSAPASVITNGTDIAEEGSRLAFWRATPSITTGDAYVIIDLGDNYSCDSAVLLLQGTGDAISVAVSYSEDNENFTDYGSLTSAGSAVTEKDILEFDLPVREKIRYVKFTSASLNKIFAVIEAEVYAVPYNAFEPSADITNISQGLVPSASSVLNNDGNLQPTRVTDGATSGWSWICGDGDSNKYLDIDLGAWYNIEKITFSAQTGGQGNDGEGSRKLINIYGSATGQFEDEKIKLTDFGKEVMTMGQVEECTVAVKNLVRYIRVTPKNRTQFSGETVSRFGFTEIMIWADKADAYYMTEKSEYALNDRKYDTMTTGDETFMTGVIMKPVAVQMITAITKENLIKNTEFNLYSGITNAENAILSTQTESGVNPLFETSSADFGKYIRYENISEAECVNEILVFYKEKDDNKYLTIDNIVLNSETLNQQDITVTADILNGGTEKITGKAVAVLYDAELCAVKSAIADFEGIVDVPGQISVTLENPVFGNDMTGYKIKVFFVEDPKAINPYRNSVMFE